MQCRLFTRQCPILTLFICAACLILLSCQKSETIEPVKIGVIAYLDGAQRESEGLPTLNAATMAIADFKAQGGLIVDGVVHPVELVVEGIEQSREASVAATRKLINRIGVVAIVGPQFSSDAIPSGSLAERAGVPMINPVATNPKTTAGKKFVFRMSFLDDAQGTAMASIALNELDAKRAAVLYNEADDYSRGVANVFKAEFERFGEVVAFESYVSGDTDYAQQLWRIREAAPEVLYLPSFHDEVATQASLVKRLGIKATLLGSDGWDQRLVPNITAFDDSYFSMHWDPKALGKKTADFFARYVEKYSDEPNGTAALSYDAVQLILMAMQQQKSTTPEAIREGLMALGPHQGAGGIIDFVGSGDPVKPVLILHVKDGEKHLLKAVEQSP